jgi:hypothetical protein
MKKFTSNGGGDSAQKNPHRSLGLATPAARHPFRHVALKLMLCAALGLLAACESAPDSHLVSAPPPPPPTSPPGTPTATQTVVVTAPVQATAVTSAGSTIIVTQAPPAPPPEAVPPRPTANHAWVPGYWTWRNQRYEWMAGHWEMPPTFGAVWFPPRWEPEGGSYRFYEGYWR